MSKFVKYDDGVKLLNAGYSIIVVDEQKKPLVSWKALQSKPWTESELRKQVDRGNVWRYGLITGYGDLFCVDVDLKVFPNPNDREPFFNELISFIGDHVDSFDKKVAIYKTANFGYHLVYRTKTDMGNVKLARRKEHKEAVIETRGVGGYIIVYDECINQMNYNSVQLLTEEEHETIIGVCRYFDEQAELEAQHDYKPKPQPAKNEEQSVTPWEDFNNRNTVLDVVGDQFDIIRQIQSRYIIRRHGSKASHSGYIYKDSGCMYLFTTGMEYPNEKLLSAYSCFTHRNHGGDYSASAKALYDLGYGDRLQQPLPKIEEQVKIDYSALNFPIDIFPEGIQRYLVECNDTLDSSIDYMGVSLVWMLSVIIGNSMRIEVKSGWTEPAIVWISCVGKAGLGKTPSIDNVIRPLVEINSREIKQYKKEYLKFKEYDSLSEREKKNAEEVREPAKKQFVVNDVTIEALVELHEENPNAVGVFKDELAGWMKDMNKYRAGSDLEFWLSSWSNKPVALNRKTVKNTYVHSPIIPVLGGIQPAILAELFTVENKDNGFVDRMLLSYPDLDVEKYNERELDHELLNWYSSYVLHMYSNIKNNVIKFDEDREVVPHIVQMTEEAKAEWRRIFNEISTLQNSDEENQYMKSILPKQKSYIPRFALMLNALEHYHKNEPILSPISKSAMIKAENLSKYFVAMAKKLKIDIVQVNRLKSIASERGKLSDFEKYSAMRLLDPKLNKTEAAEVLNVSRMTLNRWDKKIDKKHDGTT